MGIQDLSYLFDCIIILGVYYLGLKIVEAA